jgi:hypothetical protein
MSGTPPSTVRRLPTWLVSAPHGQHIDAPGFQTLWRPFGTHHARKVGSSRTACGLVALGWQLFWDMPFPNEMSVTCVECRAAVVNAASR